MRRFVWTVGLAACSQVEPIELGADPSVPAAPVGVQTVTVGELTVEVWYPASEKDDLGEPHTFDLRDLVPAEFLDRVTDLPAVPIPTRAYRDAPIRDTGEPYPIVLFSHGFGGFREQSVDLTTHLASRGYLVVSADHFGRNLYDIVPCLLNPPAGECNLSFNFADDPALDDLAALYAWTQALPEPFAERADPSRVGIFGHSAGGGSTSSFATSEAGIAAALAMGGSGTFDRDLPSAVIGGSCDGVVEEAGEDGLAATGATASDGYFSLVGGGHMAFSDICKADLGAVGEQLSERDDANPLLIDQLLSLGVDGCEGYTPPDDLEGCGGSYLPFDVSEPILRHAVAVFFDEHLRAGTEGLADAGFAELVAR